MSRSTCYRRSSLKKRWLVGLLLGVGLLHAGKGFAQEPDPIAKARASLADIGKDLIDRGIFLRGDYISESATNPIGGVGNGIAYTQQLDLGVDLDLERLVGLPGSAFHVMINDRGGRNLAQDEIGDSISVQELYGYGQNFRLSDFYWDQAFAGNRVQIKGGRLSAGDDFAKSKVYCEFQSNAVCGNPDIIGFDSNFTAYPAAVWGGRIKVSPTPRTVVQVGAYEANPSRELDSDHGFDWSFGNATGVFVPLEVGVQSPSEDDPYLYHYRLGAFYDSSNYKDPFKDKGGNAVVVTGGKAKTHNSREGVYLLGDQVVWKPDLDSKRGVTLFGFAGSNVGERVAVDFFLEAGALWRGPFAARPNDKLGFAVTDTHFSNGFARNLEAGRQLKGGEEQPDNDEVILEVNYGVVITPGFEIKPNVQYIFNPDTGNRPDHISNPNNVLVFGVKVALDVPQTLGLRPQDFETVRRRSSRFGN